MYTAVIILIIFVAVLLILSVLIQNSKGGGLAGQFGGTSSSQLMGVKRTGDLLEQITWGLAIALMVLTLSTSALVSNPADAGSNSVNIEKAQEKSSLPGGTLPTPSTQQPATTPATGTDSTNK